MRIVPALVLTGVTAAMTLTACSLPPDAICMSDEYPVMPVGGTGGSCVPKDEEPPAGHVRYPEGKVPEHVDDKWDIYWDTHTIDKNGKIIKVPNK
ncbi:SCO0607 family lipoprotein [Streptomyces sp. NPDC002446]